jgi:NitT/TauT family transport system ATP-binding protein
MTQASEDPSLSLRGVGVGFGDFQAVADVDLDVFPGEFVCLLGPSGCGKSTLLSAMAGFIPTNAGALGGADAAEAGVNRNVGMVFQSSNVLFDWLTVRQNVMFGPRTRGVPRARRREVADEYLKLVGLTNAAEKFPRQLSGGMRQRVQLARVLANEPELVLMDEPFGALDAQTREVMQQELARIWASRSCTVVFVTPDIDVAILLADRIVVMTAGPAAGIKSIHEVTLERPRRRLDPAFIELAEALREDIGTEVRKALSDQGLGV